jgi:hypothetical protein
MKIDDWFKPTIVILLIIFLVIFFLHALNGRYRPMGVENAIVLDTFTGNIYSRSGERFKPFPLPSK